jgi:hypothetical protein
MLFEVFFDSKGELRDELKADRFEEIFSLQQYSSLSESFEFISESLIPYSHKFHLLPGRAREVSVDVLTRKKGDHVRVEAVLLGGSNIFWVKGSDDEELAPDEDQLLMRSVSRSKWEKELAHALALPSRLLKVSYPKRPDIPQVLEIPYHWTVEMKST